MKRWYSRLLVTFLAFLLLFDVTAQSVQATNDSGPPLSTVPEVQDVIDQTDDILHQYSDPEQAAAEVYRSLTPEAKEILFSDLKLQENKGDIELVDMFKSFMDEADKMQFADATIQQELFAATSALSVLNAELVALRLPFIVRTTLYAVGAGISAAMADGPLPIGDVIAGVAGVAAAVAIAASWNEVSSKWDGIVNAFKKAFTSIKNDVEFVISNTLVKNLIGNINNNRTSQNKLEIYMNAGFSLMGVYDVKSNIQGRASRHLGDYQSNPTYPEYVNDNFNLTGYTLFVSYNWRSKVVFHAHFTPTWLRSRELTYNRYQYEYVWQIYPTFSYNQAYSKTKNPNHKTEQNAAMHNRGLKKDRNSKTSVVPLK